MTHPVLISACLTGRACRYDGQSKPLKTLAAALGDRPFVAVCPEELGGLGTPRPAATLQGGAGASVWQGDARVVRCADGEDLTAAFVTGATLARAQAPTATHAILKARSPSCGCGVTSIGGEKAAGDGVFAALLRAQGVALQTDEQLLNAGAVEGADAGADACSDTGVDAGVDAGVEGLTQMTRTAAGNSL